MLRRQMLAAVGMLTAMTVLCGLLYPLVVTGIAQAAVPGAADGSLLRRDGEVVGSSLIGQSFTAAEYVHPRPSAAGDGYDSMASAATNLGPTNPALVGPVDDDPETDTIAERVVAYREENSLAESVPVPIDAVTASGSGLDPHISIANARLQAGRVAAARGLDVEIVDELIDVHTDDRSLGFLGQSGVNVLELNLALDDES